MGNFMAYVFEKNKENARDKVILHSMGGLFIPTECLVEPITINNKSISEVSSR
jgi:hypothetical protein